MIKTVRYMVLFALLAAIFSSVTSCVSGSDVLSRLDPPASLADIQLSDIEPSSRIVRGCPARDGAFFTWRYLAHEENDDPPFFSGNWPGSKKRRGKP